MPAASVLQVLLLDDQEAYANLLTESLRDVAEVHAATTLPAALELRERLTLDCVLCDLRLLDVTAETAVAELVSADPDCSLLALSGAPGPDVTAALAAGADAFLLKGHELDGELEDAVVDAARRTASRRAPAGVPAPAATAPAAGVPPSSRLDMMLVLLLTMLLVLAGMFGVDLGFGRRADAVPIGLAALLVALTLVRARRREHRDRRTLLTAVGMGEQEWKALSASQRVGVFRTDARGCVTSTSACHQRLTGLEADRAIGTDWCEAVHPGDVRAVQAAWAWARGTHAEFVREVRFRHPDGTVVFAAVTASPVRSASGRVAGWVGLVVDETARHRAERELGESRARLDAVMRASSTPIYLVDPDGRFVLANPACEQFFGVAAAELVGRTGAEVRGAEYGAKVDKYNASVLDSGRARQDEIEIARPGAADQTWLSMRFPVRDADGVLVGVGVVATDVSEMRRLTKETIRHRELLEHAQSTARLATWEWDTASDTITASPTLADVLGLGEGTSDELRVRMRAAMDAAGKQQLDAAMTRARETEGIYEASLGLTVPGGARRHVRTRWRADRRDGHMVFTGGTQDVTEEHQRALALADAEEQLRLAFDHAPIGLGVCTAEGRWTRVNPALSALLGLRAGELLGASVDDVVLPADRRIDDDRRALLLAGELPVYEIEKRCVRGDGEIVPVMMSVSAAARDAGQAEHLVLQLVDVTARHDLEAQMRRHAESDALTGLPNRRRLELELARLHRRRQTDDEVTTLLLIDLEGIKAVHERRGFAEGDRLICRIADELAATVRDSDLLARLGRDEFAVLVANAGPDVAAAVVTKLRRAIDVAAAETLPGVTLSVAVGSASLHPGGAELGDTLRLADDALRAAKAEHAGRVSR